MPRATHRLTLLLALAGLIVAANAFAQQKSANTINGVGLVDYTRPPDFKVGTWVRYHTQGSSLAGAHDDYHATVLIAGEERFWGDDGFWVETWNDTWDETGKAKSSKSIATLMSYEIFKEPLPIPRMQLYMRKIVGGTDEHGQPVEELLKRPPSSLKSRDPLGGDITFAIDTLGADTVQTPAGTFQCQKYMIRQGTGVTQETRDSTIYMEMREDRLVFMSLDVPITHIVREDITYTIQRRAWRAGRSKDSAPMLMLEKSSGSARLEAKGTALKARLLSPERQKSLAEQYPPRAAKSSAPSKPATRSSGGSR